MRRKSEGTALLPHERAEHRNFHNLRARQKHCCSNTNSQFIEGRRRHTGRSLWQRPILSALAGLYAAEGLDVLCIKDKGTTQEIKAKETSTGKSTKRKKERISV
jgi:hypothetical protein